MSSWCQTLPEGCVLQGHGGFSSKSKISHDVKVPKVSNDRF